MASRSCAATMTIPAGAGRTCCRTFARWKATTGCCDERHGADGPLLVSDPGHIDDVSRWFVQSVQALGEPYNHDFNGPQQRGVGFYQFTNRRGKRSSAAYAFIAPLEGNPQSDRSARRQGATHPDRQRPRDRRRLARRRRRRTTSLRRRRSDRRRRRARHAAIADAVGHRPRRSSEARMGSNASPTCRASARI